MKQEIGFCTASDGVRIAYARSGDGPPLVKTANWLNHLEYDWQSPVWRHWLGELAREHELIRYDGRGNGLSDWDVGDISFEAFVHDLEAVVDELGVDRFALLGISQGCAVSLAYAVRNPERVTRLVLFGGYARGRANRGPEEVERARAMVTLIRQGWGQENPAFRQLFTSTFIPEATPEQMQWFNDLQRITTSPENAARIREACDGIDVSTLLPQIKAPTLVVHTRDDAVVPFEAGRQIAARIPRARFVPLEGRNHLLLETEPAWSRFKVELRAFLGSGEDGDELPPGGARKRRMGDEVLPQPVSGRSGELRVGDRVGAYEILSLIGSGGMGNVYSARHAALERKVAVKALVESISTSPSGLRRFEREAKLLASLSHPSIALVYDFLVLGERPYLILELVQGETLQERLARGALELGETLRIASQLAEAIEEAHRNGIVHRDLKPANVKLTPEGRVKVLDFGLAKLQDPEVDELQATRLRTGTLTTGSGMVLGTPGYMSPEQARAETVDQRADVWAFGCLVYEMLTGERAFCGVTASDVIAAVLRDEVAWDRLPSGTPPEFLRLLRRCLAKDPRERLQDMADARARLAELGSDGRRKTSSRFRLLPRWLRLS